MAAKVGLRSNPDLVEYSKFDKKPTRASSKSDPLTSLAIMALSPGSQNDKLISPKKSPLLGEKIFTKLDPKKFAGHMSPSKNKVQEPEVKESKKAPLSKPLKLELQFIGGIKKELITILTKFPSHLENIDSYVEQLNKIASEVDTLIKDLENRIIKTFYTAEQTKTPTTAFDFAYQSETDADVLFKMKNDLTEEYAILKANNSNPSDEQVLIRDQSLKNINKIQTKLAESISKAIFHLSK